jgi:TRAP-type C4-dicarboxylate transport system permease small subunit
MLWEESNIMHSGAKSGVIFEAVLGLLAFFADALIVFTMLAVCAEVGIRMIMGDSIPWVTEIVGYCLLWVTFLGAAYVLKEEGHIKVDILVNQMNPRNTGRLHVVTSFLGAIVCLIVAIYSARVTWQHFITDYRLAFYLELPSFLINFIIPIGCFLLFIQFLRRAHGYLRVAKHPVGGDKYYQADGKIK